MVKVFCVVYRPALSAFFSEIHIQLKKNYRKGSEKTVFLSNSMKRAVGFSLGRSWKPTGGEKEGSMQRLHSHFLMI